MSKKPSKFAELPTEIVESIARQAEPSALLSLRLTCQLLSSKVARIFAQTWFASTLTDLTPKSLKKLQGISESEHLREHVKKLVVPCDMRERPTRFLGQGFRWPRSDHGRLDKPQNFSCVQQLQRILLTDLTHCRSFRIEGYGFTEHPYQEHIGPSDVLYIILGIITETGITVRSFDLDYKCCGLYYDRFDYKICRQPRFREAWANIHELRLAFAITSTSKIFDFSTDLMNNARCLQVLSLRPGYDDRGMLLGQYLAHRDTLLSLRELYLHNACVDSESLSQLLVASQDSLRKIVLSFVYIHGDDWAKIINHLSTHFSRLQSFELDFCKQIDSTRELLLSYKDPTDQVPTLILSNERRPPDFRDLPPLTMTEENSGPPVEQSRLNSMYNWLDSLEHATGVKYEGSHMAEALRAIINSIELIEFEIGDGD